MDKESKIEKASDSDTTKLTETALEQAMGEELTDEQLLQMAEGSCSWGANCNRGC
jgi:hypothetical protein